MNNNNNLPLILATGAATTSAIFYFLYHINKQIENLASVTLRRNHVESVEGKDSLLMDYASLDSLMNMHSAVCNDRELNTVIERIIEVSYKLINAERISMMILSRDKKKLTVAESKDALGVEISVDKGIAGYVAKSGLIVNIKDAYKDPRFNCQLDMEKEFRTKSILCAPIMINHEVVGVITAINKFADSGKDVVTTFKKSDEFIIEYVASNAGIAIKKAQLYHQAVRQQRNSEAILQLVRARSSDESVEKILTTTIDAAYSLLLPELVSVYLCDHSMQEAWICVSKDGLEGLTIPFGHGIAGTVAATGKTIRIDNAYTDCRFCSDVDSQTGFKTKSILCVAVPGFATESKPIAVIQLINKLNGRGFDEDDEEALTMFCQEVSVALRRKVLELNLLRYSTYLRNRPDMIDSLKLEESLLNEYGSVAQKFNYSNMIRSKAAEARRSSHENVGRIHSNGPIVEQHVIHQILLNWNLDPFEINDADLMIYAEQMLIEFDILNILKVDIVKVRTFILGAHSMYHSSNSFHNFKHGWSVMHITYRIICAGVGLYLTDLDILGVLIAALCHDLDHPGNNNAFEVAIRSELAILHSDDSVLERHHASMVHKLLSNPECNIFENLSSQTQAEMRQMITDTILATDMTVHFFHVQHLEDRVKCSPPFEIDKQASRRKLLGHVVHAADLSGQVFDLPLALKWGDGCIKEFRKQSQREQALGLPLTPFMTGLDDELQQCRVQSGFVSNIVLPLWSALAGCFPELQTQAIQASANASYYMQRIKELSAPASNNPESEKI